jgi:hypothetical protein
MTTLPFTANGHDTPIPDGTLSNVFTDGFWRLFIPELAFPCRTCGQDLKLLATDGSVTVREPCPYPDGLTSVITLDVPSGKLIVADSLRPAYNWTDADLTASYNSKLGQYQAVLAMAAQGCAFGPVGNTCPGLYRTGDGTYAIASLDYDEDQDEEIVPAGWRKLAGIITDLWAYSIAGYEDWKAKGGNPIPDGWSKTLVEVPPGTYEFTHHTGKRSFNDDGHGTITYASIRYLGNEKGNPS